MNALLADYTPKERRGVVYLPSVPPTLTKTELRAHFISFGDIMRMKVSYHDEREGTRSGKHKSRRPPRIKEAYIEFGSLTSAQRAAARMNATPVECNRKRKCYGQLWLVRYMGGGFSLDSLAEEREAARRLRRAAEAESRQTERDTNELYRKLVMDSVKKKQQRQVFTHRRGASGEWSAKNTGRGGNEPGTSRAAASISTAIKGRRKIDAGVPSSADKPSAKKSKRKAPKEEQKTTSASKQRKRKGIN